MELKLSLYYGYNFNKLVILCLNVRLTLLETGHL